MRRAFLILALAALCGPAWAQRSRAQTPAPVPAAAAATEPQRTTATFGDWTLRCVRPEHGTPACEVSQVLYDKSQPVAQTALGRPTRGEAMRLTVQVPPNVLLATAPRLLGAEGDAPIELTWRRCLPVGCFADAALTEDQVKRLRGRTENGRVVFQDGAGREAAIPFVPRGLPQALDALSKEDGR